MSRSVLAVTALALLSSASLAQTIVRGPIYNPTTGARYYAVQASTWAAANTYATSLGCTMATITDAAENSWVAANFSPQLSNSKLFIGLNDSVTEGTMVWTSGTSSYTNWAPGEPTNDANRDYTVLAPNGQWSFQNATYTSISIIKTAGALRVPQEYPTVAAAVAALPAAGTGIIYVNPGTYPIDSTITVPAPGGLIQSSAPGDLVFLAPTGGPAFSFNGGWTLRNVTIQGRANQSLVAMNTGSAVYGFDLHLRPLAGSIADQVQLAANSDFRMDSGSFFGGGPVFRCVSGGTALLRSTLIDSTMGLSSGSGSNIAVYGSTITRCGPGSVFAAGNTHSIVGSIIWGNPGVIDSTRFHSGFTDVQVPAVGFGNISVDPRFKDVAAGDFHLSPGSPCIDRGTIQTVTCWIANPVGSFVDAGLNSRLSDDPSTPNGSEGFPSCDMGAFEFQGNSCPADFNLDGVVDFFDYLDFVDAFSIGC